MADTDYSNDSMEQCANRVSGLLAEVCTCGNGAAIDERDFEDCCAPCMARRIIFHNTKDLMRLARDARHNEWNRMVAYNHVNIVPGYG